MTSSLWFLSFAVVCCLCSTVTVRPVEGQSSNGGDQCSGNKDVAACGNQEGCVWCKSKSVPNACLAEMHSASLPKSIFFCDLKKEEGFEKIALLKGEIFAGLHIIPFEPSAQVSVTFGKSVLVMGKNYDKALCHLHPSISFVPSAKALFAVMMIDLDAPGDGNYLHLFYADIDGQSLTRKVTLDNDKIASGKTLMPYAPPTPPSGVHRYVILIAQQGKPWASLRKIQRPAFDTAAFLEENQLTAVGLTYFTVAA